jgi:putative lipoic acid-binding regulatory protein
LENTDQFWKNTINQAFLLFEVFVRFAGKIHKLERKNRKMQINDQDKLKNEKIIFPIDYNIKIILDATITEQESKAEILAVFENLDIPHFDWKTKLSSGGKYISFTIEIKIKDQPSFDSLYKQLNNIDGIKWAV